MKIEDVKVGQRVLVAKDWSFFPSLHQQVVTVVRIDVEREFVTIRSDGGVEDTGGVADLAPVDNPCLTVKEKLQQVETLVAEIKALLG
jgi:hypothetical protein